jgi:PTH2 family peptidyl-tRNA hydrolase
VPKNFGLTSIYLRENEICLQMLKTSETTHTDCGISTMREFEYKQILVFRQDLQLSKGKIAAQAGHAAVSAAQDAYNHQKKWWEAWLYEGQRKIAVKVADEKALRELEKAAEDVGLPHALIVDAGLTEIPEGTVTCLGIGPAPADRVDRLTIKLRLL